MRRTELLSTSLTQTLLHRQRLRRLLVQGRVALAFKVSIMILSLLRKVGANSFRRRNLKILISSPPSSFTEVKLVSGGPLNQPKITVEDFDEAEKHEKVEKHENVEQQEIPSALTESDERPIIGELGTAVLPAIPDWYRVGWRAVSGIDRPIAEGEALEQNVISMFMHEMYYGQWFHNAGVIFFVSSLLFLPRSLD